MALEIEIEQIEKYLKLDRERKELAAQAEQKQKECDLLSTHFKDWLKAKRVNTARRGNYTLSLSDGPKYPKWKDEFIKLNGEEAATQIVAATQPSKRLTIVHK